MGVKSCNRLGCDNIMCDTYVDGIGYICYDCQSEFIKRNENRHDTKDSADKALDVFMYTRKSAYEYVRPEAFDVYELFK